MKRARHLVDDALSAGARRVGAPRRPRDRQPKLARAHGRVRAVARSRSARSASTGARRIRFFQTKKSLRMTERVRLGVASRDIDRNQPISIGGWRRASRVASVSRPFLARRRVGVVVGIERRASTTRCLWITATSRMTIGEVTASGVSMDCDKTRLQWQT